MPSEKLSKSGSALAVSVALLTSTVGCADDPLPESSNRGSGSDTVDTSVENAYIVPTYVPGRCAIQLNAGGALRFTLTNNRPAETERLLGISTSAAEQARVIRDVVIPPKSTVSFGEPNAEPGVDDASAPAVVLDRLDPDLVPATSTDVTFRFERAGEVTLPVPVEACPVQQP
ncbi:hypothetical protein [Mycolicibacterium gilvum]|uniref:Uncharacterized protein n=2 Tax=Mycolicibacterium gilvum TaxID=1804 RepID=E6TD56_MYCSR|nr:hypothetical protein [Mycolicibacterium gilvum]ADT99764.1 hypothetical protein Mspyr1_31480 [Mycolicibacterium gilvum Spyr1]MCV7058325.1 hypothetical protein [Mycolicibacterium gilvum]STZ43294.1 Protein of uncharacterised function (DUF461) [Mycolicibacterium gilvum]